MSLLQQAIQLLSESPGNIVYHLVTLFALQAVFAIAVGQWRRNHSDEPARRTAWASGAIFTARLALLFAVLIVGEQTADVLFLPPLEQAVHTVTAVFLVWALAPASTRWPRLGNVLLWLTLIVVGVTAVFFVQQWQVEGLSGQPYNSSQQATVWGVVQIIILTIGLLLTLAHRRLRLSLHPLVISLLLLAHATHFWNYPEIIPTGTDIAYWLRLGHLVVFPLWAVVAYRHSLAPLLVAQQHRRPPATQLTHTLQLSTHVIDSLELQATLREAVQMVAQTIDAAFVGIAVTAENNPQQLHLLTNLPQPSQNQPRSWYLTLPRWPAFWQAMEQKQGVELLPNGLGARQLYNFYQEVSLSPLGAMLVQPLLVDEVRVGVLLLAGLPQRDRWPEPQKKLAAALAGYVAQAIHNVRLHAQVTRQAAAVPVFPEPETGGSGRIIALEAERDKLSEELETAQNRLHQAETRAAEARRQALDLAATIEEMERVSRDEKIAHLEAEIVTLRESLTQAEEALAMASAAEAGLSTEWVMHTITHYSGQLEEAQSRIEALENALSRHEKGPSDEVLVSLTQELRTPMTSVAGYTDLLLAETVGILGTKQREFLQRVRANIARMDTLLDQLVQLTTTSEAAPSLPARELVNVQEVIETAVHTVITQIREKSLRLDLNIAADLPPLAVNQQALYQIVVNLLENACQASRKNGRITVSAHADVLRPSHENGSYNPIHFMHLAVKDSGQGIHTADLARVFAPQHRADAPLISGVGDRGAGLSVARSLAENNGGRMWVHSETGVGSTFSVLFPVVSPEAASDAPTSDNGTQ